MDIVDRILETAAKNKGISSLKALEEELNFGNGTIGKWREKSPSCKKVKDLADFLNTSIDYLVSGTENSIADPNIKELINNYNKADIINKGRILERAAALAEFSATKKVKNSYSELSNNELKKNTIKLFDTSVSAGTGIDIDYSTHTEITTTEDTEGADFAVRVSGDSMTPRFRNADIVLVESTPRVDVGEIGIFILNGQAYIKELGENMLISLNKKYPPIEFTDSDSIYCQGRVIKILSVAQEA